MFGYDNPQATFPEVQLCREMIRHTLNISNDCYRIRYRIAALHAQLVISETAQDTLRCVGDYVLCVSDTIDACFQLFLAIRRTIESDDISLESGLATIHDRYRSFIQLLAELASMKDPTLRSLDSLQNYIDTKLSYPPVVHTLVMRVLGPNRSHRERLDLSQSRKSEAFGHRCALDRELGGQGCDVLHAGANRIQKRRNLREDDLPVQARSEVGWLFSQSLGGLPFWADKAKVHGSCILNLAVPVRPIDRAS